MSAFGINAWTAAEDGAAIIAEHAEAQSGQEEIYLVLSGRATFTLDGEELAAPAGTAVFLPAGPVKRKAIAEEDGTTVLAIGGWTDKAFVPSASEWVFDTNARETPSE